MSAARGQLHSLRRALEERVLGQSEAVDLSLTALLAGGHLLLEGPPGVGKTSLAQGLAESFGAVFRRVQMTSDMLPSDIVGTLRMKGGDFEFRPGPIFANVLLADELNRTSAKTQSALLEAMAENRVTVDGTTYPLPDPFFVVATQNPHEFQGVYPLAESQLDRFMMHVELTVPGEAAELGLLQRHGRGDPGSSGSEALRTEDLLFLREECRKLFLEESLTVYAQKIAQRVRQGRDVAHGASVRAMLQLLDAAKARAYLRERDFVAPEDIQAVASAVLGHRLCLRGPAMSAQGRKELIREAMAEVAAPR